MLFSILFSFTMDIPIGFGLLGAFVENSPLCSLSKKGCTFKENPWINGNYKEELYEKNLQGRLIHLHMKNQA